MPEFGPKQIIAAIVALVLLVGLAIYLGGTGGSSMRQEVPLNVDLIRTAEIEYQEAFESFVSAEAAPRDPLAVDGQPVAWVPTKGFKKLSWKPATEEVYGSYSVNATSEGFTVSGVCDVDGDHTQARFQATKAETARMTTPEAIY